MPRPSFRYRIDALRVDGNQSADPRDYRDYPESSPVGAELHAYVTAELERDLAPGDLRGRRGERIRWPVPEALLLVLGPTVGDLRRWSRVRFVAPSDCAGSYRPLPS